MQGAGLDIVGFELPLRFRVPVALAVSTVKDLIQSMHGVPVARQTLSRNSVPLEDGRTLASYGIQNQQTGVTLELQVTSDEGPITVTLVSPQFPQWRATVRCRETTTVGEFKRLAADQVSWAETDGMELFKGHHGTRLDREENLGRPVRDWLVIDGTSVNVRFTTNVPQNGHRPPGPQGMM